MFLRFLSLVFCLNFTLTVFSQPKISTITFTGNEFFSSEDLRNMTGLKPGMVFSREQFSLDLRNVIENYQKQGFLNTRISRTEESFNFDSTAINLDIAIDEGKRILIGEIDFQGNRIFDRAALLAAMFIKPGNILDMNVLNLDIERVLKMYEEKGFAFAQVRIRDISTYFEKGSEKLRIIVRIDENEKIKIDDISIEGNTTTKDYVIMRELRAGKNKTITREGLVEIKQHLENLRYFESVEEPRLYRYNDRTVLKIKVSEGNTNTFDGIVGYVPPSSDEDNGYFTGFINLSLRNLFGTGRSIDARWQKEIKTTQELELKYLEPWLLGYPVNISTGFFQRVQDSAYVKRNFEMKAEVLVSKNFTTSVTSFFERVIPSPETAGLTYTIFDSRLLAAGLEIKYDSRDYLYNPSSGILYKTGYSVGQKKIYNAFSFLPLEISPNLTIHRLIVDLDFYHSFFKRQTSLISLHGGEVNSSKLEEADYFKLGGIHSVRGYRENQFLGSRMGWANLEVRYSLTRKSFASVFYDFGYYKRQQDEITKAPEQHGFIFGYGIGIRIETKLGIFGVSYALGKGDGILDGKIHFGLINEF